MSYLTDLCAGRAKGADGYDISFLQFCQRPSQTQPGEPSRGKGERGERLSLSPTLLQVIFRGGEGALQVLPPLLGVVGEARLNLAIYHLKQGVCIPVTQ